MPLPTPLEVTAIDLSGGNLTAVAIVGVIAIIALVMAMIFRREVLAASDGTPNMQVIALAVQEGALITDLLNGGPAQVAGLQVRDVIVSIDNMAINMDTSYNTLLLGYRPGATATLTGNTPTEGANVVFTVTLSAPSGQTVTAGWSTTPVTRCCRRWRWP